MAEGRMIPHHGEAIVLRTWPFHEADLLVSLLTREQGRVKGVARHAMKSRKRFGGALEPATYVRAHYTERPRQDLVRMDSFEILWSPMTAPVDYLRTAGMQVVVEVLEEALPELAPEDNVFRLSMAALKAMEAAVTASGREDRGKGAPPPSGSNGASCLCCPSLETKRLPFAPYSAPSVAAIDPAPTTTLFFVYPPIPCHLDRSVTASP